MKAERGMVLVLNVFLDVKDKDPNDVAMAFDAGTDHVERAIQGFPEAEVWGVNVETIREPTEDEASGYLSE